LVADSDLTGLARFVNDVRLTLEATGVTVPHATGRKHLKEHAETDRIVWVSKGGPGGPAVATSLHPRAIATRQLTVEAWIFAPDYATCETRLAQLTSAIRIRAMGFYEFKGESAPFGDDATLKKGEVIVATYLIRLAIDDVPATTVTLTDADASPDTI
jgi:hypothetical protein